MRDASPSSRLPSKLFKKFWVVCRSNQLCMQCPSDSSSQSPAYQINVFFVVGHRHHLHNSTICGSVSFHENCLFNASSSLGEFRQVKNYQQLPQQLQISWPWHLSLPAQHHPTVYRRLLQDVKNFPPGANAFHPQRLSCHSWPNAEANFTRSQA